MTKKKLYFANFGKYTELDILRNLAFGRNWAEVRVQMI